MITLAPACLLASINDGVFPLIRDLHTRVIRLISLGRYVYPVENGGAFPVDMATDLPTNERINPPFAAGVDVHTYS